MEPKKKMNLTQLTFIVTVNMMGSGIIMLPTNMARVGAISLLSWVITAVGSMAIAYGFAQAGLFNQRPGGMAAYAEDAYQKPGYFQVFFLYFLSLAIGNVAIAISAVGYLASFVPWLSSTPVATTVGVIGLIWLTTFANFGGAGVTGKIGSVTVWGVLIPVGMLCLIGWFWFKPDTFAAAWNPQGMSWLQGMGSSIALTLWAFLGMESAAQNSAAVENPKRDVPLACMFGTLGAAVIYVLSTTVIQGIVPNAELASSTGPFGLAYAKMFNPVVGSIIMGLAVMACLGSLLGWQFTLAQTAKSAADERMFPGVFGKENRLGAPIAGMIVLGVVQSGLALSTMSPSLSEQFGALVNLAVVTNVVPYIIALSALPLMMRLAGVEKSKYQRNVAVTLVALAYSVYAIYASGKDAVFGGMIVMGIAYVIWGSIAHRFTPQAGTAGKDAGLPLSKAAAAAVLLAIGALALAAPAAGATLDQIKQSGKLRFGYRADAVPLSFRDPSGKPAGYSVELCRDIAEAAKKELGLPGLTVEWVSVTAESRFDSLKAGEIDVLCGSTTVTLARRAQVSFSLPIFPGGIGALIRADAPARLREALEGRAQVARPAWRGAPAAVLQARTFAVVRGTTTQAWLEKKKQELQVIAETTGVDSYEAGVRRVLEGKSDVFFGDRILLLNAREMNPAQADLVLLDRLFTFEPVALALQRGDEDLRLLVDRTLSRLYRSGDIQHLYATWCGGEPDADALAFFRMSTLPE
jgi:putrescine:ornithine antiporter